MVGSSGKVTLSLTATSTTGLPDITSMRIFLLEEQPVTQQTDTDTIEATETENDETVEVYSLTGHRICKTHLSQLGISLGSRPSAVVTLPHTVMNGMGNTPYIVRRIQ